MQKMQGNIQHLKNNPLHVESLQRGGFFNFQKSTYIFYRLILSKFIATHPVFDQIFYTFRAYI
jgi:hypothetical protein